MGSSGGLGCKENLELSEALSCGLNLGLPIWSRCLWAILQIFSFISRLQRQQQYICITEVTRNFPYSALLVKCPFAE